MSEVKYVYLHYSSSDLLPLILAGLLNNSSVKSPVTATQSNAVTVGFLTGIQHLFQGKQTRISKGQLQGCYSQGSLVAHESIIIIIRKDPFNCHQGLVLVLSDCLRLEVLRCNVEGQCSGLRFTMHPPGISMFLLTKLSYHPLEILQYLKGSIIKNLL